MFKEVVNIMPDEKFIDDYIRISEKNINSRSSYLVLNDGELKFVKSQNEEIYSIQINSDFHFSNDLIYKLNNCRVIILHSFNYKYLNFINRISKNIRIIWMFWGIDGYNAITKSKYLSFDTVTMQYKNNLTGKLKSYARFFLNHLLLEKQKSSKKIILRADFCATFVKDDFYIAKNINPKIKTLYFSYFNDIGYKLLVKNETKNNTEINALLGNSANPSNEHFQALKYLLKINFKGKIYCPLSYSGTETYINNIIDFGKCSFGNKFIPITKFLSYDEYSKIISDCDFIIMNHIRQQAVGNIFKSICLLKPVILNKRSYLRSTFLEWGIKIYDLDVLKNQEHIEISSLKTNREIVLRKVNEKNNYHFFNKIIEISKS